MLYAPLDPKLGIVPDAIQLAMVCLICPSVIFVAGAVLIVMRGLSFPIPTLYCDSLTEYVLSDSMSTAALSILFTQAALAGLEKNGPQYMFYQVEPFFHSGPPPYF